MISNKKITSSSRTSSKSKSRDLLESKREKSSSRFHSSTESNIRSSQLLKASDKLDKDDLDKFNIYSSHLIHNIIVQKWGLQKDTASTGSAL